jgi:hypothetical protein
LLVRPDIGIAVGEKVAEEDAFGIEHVLPDLEAEGREEGFKQLLHVDPIMFADQPIVEDAHVLVVP